MMKIIIHPERESKPYSIILPADNCSWISISDHQ